MRIPRVYCPEPIPAASTRLQLNSETSHYLSKVLRMQAERELILFDGQLEPNSQQAGHYLAKIVELSKKSVVVELLEFIPSDNESPIAIHLGIGVSKGDKLDWIIQKAAELGVSSITPLNCLRSDVKIPAERLAKRQLHWQQVAISACEQCQRDIVPVVEPLTNSLSWATEIEAELKFVLHHRAETGAAKLSPQSIALMIGPEGGLNEEEIKHALEQGFKALKLGPRVMRTETAPIAALAVLQNHFGDIEF